MQYIYILVRLSIWNDKIKLSSGTFWGECEMGWYHHTSRSESQQLECENIICIRHRWEMKWVREEPISPSQRCRMHIFSPSAACLSLVSIPSWEAVCDDAYKVCTISWSIPEAVCDNAYKVCTISWSIPEAVCDDAYKVCTISWFIPEAVCDDAYKVCTISWSIPEAVCDDAYKVCTISWSIPEAVCDDAHKVCTISWSIPEAVCDDAYKVCTISSATVTLLSRVIYDWYIGWFV